MLKEAIDKITHLADAARKPDVLEVDGEERRVLIAVGGKIDWHELPPPAFRPIVTSLVELCNVFDHFHDSAAAGSFWIDEPEAIAIFDEAEPRTFAVLPLVLSTPFETLCALPSTYTQQDLLHLFRVTFSDIIDPATVDVFRRINFHHQEEGHAKFARSDESLGRSIQNAVVSEAGEIPTRIPLTLPVFDTDGFASVQTITLDVFTNVKKETFRLEPLPGELNQAKKNALANGRGYITKRLKERPSVSVFAGNPGT